MDPDREAEAPGRGGPGGRSSAVRSSSRRPVASAASKKPAPLAKQPTTTTKPAPKSATPPPARETPPTVAQPETAAASPETAAPSEPTTDAVESAAAPIAPPATKRKAAARTAKRPARTAVRDRADAPPAEEAASAAAPAPAAAESPAAAPAPAAEPMTAAEPTTPEPATTAEPAPTAQAAAAAASIPTPSGRSGGLAISIRGLTKSFGAQRAVDAIDLDIPAGTFAGFVGPNGAGKTTTLMMLTGLLRPDAGRILVHGVDVWHDPSVAKRMLGALPDRLRLFDRLTGMEFLHHAGGLRGLDRATIARRSDDLVAAFGLGPAMHRLISDYSAGMLKRLGIAAALLHAPRVLVFDEPFESVDPVSADSVIAILKRYTAAGGTVLLSSHSMGLIERICDSVAIIADGRILASGPMDEVLRGARLEERFVELAGGETAVAGMEWLLTYTE